jgi:hypothetical protein
MTRKTTRQYAAELLTKHNLVLTSEYCGAHSTVEFLCENNHKNSATATNLLQRGYKCKQCLHNRSIEPKLNWTQANVDKLQQLVNKRTPLEEIAASFNTTNSGINNALAKFNIARPKSDISLVKLIDTLLEQNRELLTENFTGQNTLVEVRCAQGHVHQQEANNIISKNTGCPSCFHGKGTSRGEQSLTEFIKLNYNGWIIEHDRTLLQGKELDLILPDLGLCFEYNGSYWHSEHKVSETYHLDKTTAVEQIDYQLIHINEYAWINKRQIVESRIRSLLGLTTKIPARKCVVQKIKYPKQFLDANHLQGRGVPTGINYGLYYENQLVATMTFSKSRYRKEYQYELIRYCSVLNTTIIGGASKLLRAFEREFNPTSIVSYANRDYSQGNIYQQLGFVCIDITKPGYTYNKRGEELQLSRFKFQKAKLQSILPNYDPQLTELENMHNHNYYRVYDSGNLVYAKQYPLI